MADSEIQSNSVIVPKLVADQAFEEYLGMFPSRKFMGTSPNDMIHVNEDLTKNQGDAVSFTLVSALKGEGVEGDGTLEGNEEELFTHGQQVTVTERSNATRDKGVMTRRRAKFEYAKAQKSALANWFALDAERRVAKALHSIDGKAFNDADAAERNAWMVNNADRVLFGSAVTNAVSGVHATALATIDASGDKLTGKVITTLKRRAKLADPKIRPIKIDNGVEMYVYLAHPLCFRDFEEDVKTDQRDALPRDINHPIFRGANMIMYRGVLVVEWEYAPLLAGVGDNAIDVGVNFLCGAQALLYAQAGYDGSERMRLVEETFDYGRKNGAAIMSIYEIKKAMFDTGVGGAMKDHGVITHYAAAVAD